MAKDIRVRGGLGLLFFLTAGAALPVQAEHSFILGGGVGFESDPIENEDDDLGATPIALYQNDDLFGGELIFGWADGLTAEYTKDNILGFGDELTVAIGAASYRYLFPYGIMLTGLVVPRDSVVDGADEDNDAVLDGDIDRDTAVDIGAIVSYITPYGLFSLGLFEDVRGVYKGPEVQLDYNWLAQPTDGWEVEASVGVSYRTSDLATYLYGIEEKDVVNDDDAFRVDDHFVPSIGLSSEFEITDGLTLSSEVGAEYLPEEVTDSPLIEDDYLVEASVNLTYRFSPF